MVIRQKSGIRPSEITSKDLFESRRRFLKYASVGAIGAVNVGLAGTVQAHAENEAGEFDVDLRRLAPGPSNYALPGVEPTPRKKAVSHNNFYEMGTSKTDPSRNSGLYQPNPWEVRVHGAVAKPRTFGIEEIEKLAPLEERIYRLRCVEAWSMVIPWIGYSFNHLAKAVEPTGSAKYVAFSTFNPDDLFPSEANGSLDWPYVEGLRIDEAMHPLTLLTVGMYGTVLPTQNGAPVRMIIPWKYGFKSGKAVVDVEFMENEPETAWNKLQPREYGFYANVNPNVSHPRWSQASEKAISDSIFPSRRDTEMFNGYGDEVASLYTGMDLAKFY